MKKLTSPWALLGGSAIRSSSNMATGLGGTALSNKGAMDRQKQQQEWMEGYTQDKYGLMSQGMQDAGFNPALAITGGGSSVAGQTAPEQSAKSNPNIALAMLSAYTLGKNSKK